MTASEELRKYAFSFQNYLISNIGQEWLSGIRGIILFGSVAQGRATKDSDVDIFIDAPLKKTKTDQLRRHLSKKLDKFALSNDALAFKTKNIFSDIHFVIGDIDGWPEMKKTLSAGSIIMYGKYGYVFDKKGLKHQFVFFWDSVRKNRSAFLNKLYGYAARKTRYKGFLDNKGVKIGKSAAMIPAEHKEEFMQILKKYCAEYTVMEVYTE